MTKNRVVTIDGPAASGKSSAGRLLAARLGFEFLPTGLHYRLAAYAADRAGLAPDDGPRLAALLAAGDLRIADNRAFCDGADVTDAVGARGFGPRASAYGEVAEVRAWVNAKSHEFAAGRNVVTEGRDQGTVVFPEAACKFYLDAPARVRAERRHADLAKLGPPPPLAELEAELVERDRRDAARTLAPLKQAEDAVVVATAGKTLEQVVDALEAVARRKRFG